MRYLKAIALLALAVPAVLQFAAVASATELTSPAGTIYTGTVKSETEGHLTFHGPTGSGIRLECTGSGEGAVEQHGAGVTVKGNLTIFSTSTCTNGWSLTTLAKGSLEVHGISGTNNGTLTSSGTEGTMYNSATSIHCIYKTSSTSLGTLTGGSPATVDLQANIPRTGGTSGIFCGSSMILTGSAKVSSPNSLFVS